MKRILVVALLVGCFDAEDATRAAGREGETCSQPEINWNPLDWCPKDTSSYTSVCVRGNTRRTVKLCCAVGFGCSTGFLHPVFN